MKSTHFKNLIVLFAFFYLLFAVLSPAVVFATHNGFHLVPICNVTAGGDGGIVPGTECTACHFWQLVLNFITFFFSIAAAAAALFLAIGGFFMMVPTFGGGAPGMYEKGKKYVFNTLIGIGIMFVAWLTIDFIIKEVGEKGGTLPKAKSGGQFGPWNSIEC